MKITEKQFEAQVKELATLTGWLYYHTYRSTRSAPGFPDCVMVRGGRLIFAELKVSGGKTSDYQWQWIKALQDAISEVYLWYPSDWQDICTILN